MPARRAVRIPASLPFPLLQLILVKRPVEGNRRRLIWVNRGKFVHRNNPSAIADAATLARASGQYIGK